MLTPEHWLALGRHAGRLEQVSLPELLAREPARADAFALRVGPIYASFARQRIDAEAWDRLSAFWTP